MNTAISNAIVGAFKLTTSTIWIILGVIFALIFIIILMVTLMKKLSKKKKGFKDKVEDRLIEICEQYENSVEFVKAPINNDEINFYLQVTDNGDRQKFIILVKDEPNYSKKWEKKVNNFLKKEDKESKLKAIIISESFKSGKRKNKNVLYSKYNKNILIIREADLKSWFDSYFKEFIGNITFDDIEASFEDELLTSSKGMNSVFKSANVDKPEKIIYDKKGEENSAFMNELFSHASDDDIEPLFKMEKTYSKEEQQEALDLFVKVVKPFVSFYIKSGDIVKNMDLLKQKYDLEYVDRLKNINIKRLENNYESMAHIVNEIVRDLEEVNKK